MRVALIALAILLTGCESCAERGGKLVFSHFLHVGKVLMPQYRCEVPKDAGRA